MGPVWAAFASAGAKLASTLVSCSGSAEFDFGGFCFVDFFKMETGLAAFASDGAKMSSMLDSCSGSKVTDGFGLGFGVFFDEGDDTVAVDIGLGDDDDVTVAAV